MIAEFIDVVKAGIEANPMFAVGLAVLAVVLIGLVIGSLEG